MPFAINTLDFPKGGLQSYTDALRHWESRDNIWHDTNWRPIGTKNCLNKQMHKEHDGSITFKLYHKECVSWHEDDSITIHGHDTMSTTSFVDALTPSGVNHAKGRIDDYEPVLHLRGPQPDTDGLTWEESRPIRMRHWNNTMVIKCWSPVTLRKQSGGWAPVGELEPFRVPVIDRKLAREVAREYRLAEFEAVAQAAVVLQQISARSRCGMFDIADALRCGNMAEAISMVPVGGVSKSFGCTYGGPGQITPGFMRKLRNWIYDHEGAMVYEQRLSLTLTQYRKYIADSKRLFS